MDDQRYPISVRLIGVMHKEKDKTYITSVLWSDKNEIVTKGGGQKKGTSRSVLRLKILEKYCEELLSCDPWVTQSPDLVRFFHPTAQDLNPEYVSNSIMVMPSDDVIVGEGKQDRTHSTGNVIQPIVTESYRCVASYETKDTKNKPFKVALDESVDVLIKDKAGWWLVENEDKRLAWFPAPYLEKVDEDGDDVDGEDETDSPTGIGALYTAVKSYKATKGDEVSVNIGSVVEVLQKSDNGWWLIRSGGKVGYVPTLYLQPYNNPRVRMASLQQDLRGSNLNLSLGGYNPNVRSHSQGNILQVQPPGLGGYNPNVRNHSQGNILQVQPRSLGGYNPNDRRHSQGHVLELPATPSQQRLGDQHRSHSLDIPNNPSPVTRPAPPTKSYSTADSTSPSSPFSGGPLPMITVEVDGGQHLPRGSTLESHSSEASLGSDSSEFSFSDDLSSDGSSTLNLSRSMNEQQLRLSRTPPPGTMSSNHLRPTTSKMMPSVSDPNLFKGPTMPKVPPRPRAQEILTRCTTVTRKNASKGGPSPTSTDVQSR
ncbi:hypothetical protein CRUP_004458 [Coryphaenoides rupestris]|nr:hypothetical protein CRUP_004458 [Coryphaenoides rupestris]